tara:strand:- start:4055 stop:4237 length:183 start_codon:yes stop_codon:yes gene_type:complete
VDQLISSHNFIKVNSKLPWLQAVFLSSNIKELFFCYIPATNRGSAGSIELEESYPSTPTL